MSKVLRPDYDQVYLFPPTLEELLQPTDPARFVRQYVNLVRAQGTVRLKMPKETLVGRPGYDAWMMLSLWLYGYLNKIHKYRALEAACKTHIGYIWLAGMYQPDHNAFYRWFRDNRKAFKRLFRDLVKVAKHMDMVQLVLHAFDGTKILAACNKEGAYHQDKVTKLLAQVDAAIEELMARTTAAALATDAEEAVSGEVQALQVQQTALRDALEALTKAETKHLQPGEPDARMIKQNNGTIAFSYNAQTAVDAGGFIVAETVTNAESDNQLLSDRLDDVEETLGQVADTNLTDGGFYSPEQLAQIEASQRNVLMNLLGVGGFGQAEGFRKQDFTWEAEADQYRCPAGHVLPFLKNKTKKSTLGAKIIARLYHCPACADCPQRALCTKSATGRTVERLPHDDLLDQLRAEQQAPEQQALLKRRGAIVERPYAVIKELMGFRRFTVRGLEKVQAQWSLICHTYNLRLVLARWQQGRVDWGLLQVAYGVVAQKELLKG
jgi:transposase